MADEMIRLACLKFAVKLWCDTVAEGSESENASEVLDAAKDFYAWVKEGA